MRVLQPLRKLGRTQARQHALEALFLRAPDPLLAQHHRQRPAVGDRALDAVQRPDVVGQRPVHQHRGFALGLQAVEHALHPRRLAVEHGLGQLERVVARDIEHRALDLLEAQFALRVKQRQLLDLLVRGQQIALDPVGHEGQDALARLARGDALALLLQALRDPARQLGPLDRIDPHRHAMGVERAEPGAFLGRGIEPRQQHQRQRAVVAGRPGGDLLQRDRTLLARLARRDADLDQLLVGEQAQRAAGGQHRAPVEMRAGDGEDAALAVTLGACGGADRVGRLLLQQRIVTVQGVEGFQPALQLRG